MKIFLIGFPGSGKTFLGENTAHLLEFPFFDSDQMIETEVGESIHSIFKIAGEDSFRKKETEIIRSFARKRQAVVSTGGGLPCYNDNMEWMKANGLTIYLDASAAFLYHRLVKEKKKRPLISALSDIELMIYITETLAVRKPFYEKASLTINAETCTPVKLFSAIKKRLN